MSCLRFTLCRDLNFVAEQLSFGRDAASIFFLGYLHGFSFVPVADCYSTDFEVYDTLLIFA